MLKFWPTIGKTIVKLVYILNIKIGKVKFEGKKIVTMRI